MIIKNIPELYINNQTNTNELFVHDLKMKQDNIKSKVNLSMHMFNFLHAGEKQVHFSKISVNVNNKQSLLIKKGNCIWSEFIAKQAIYYCKLFFFSEKKLTYFLNTYIKKEKKTEQTPSYFIIENDSYIKEYLNSLSSIVTTPSIFINHVLSIKFEELLFYLLNKYKKSFENYLYSLITEETSQFKKIIKKNTYSNLSIEEFAFLCNMSLSTFKRTFVKEYKISPGKWLKEKRLLKARELLEQKHIKPSDIYLDCGYNNLSNFSNAFKNRFGINPSKI